MYRKKGKFSFGKKMLETPPGSKYNSIYLFYFISYPYGYWASPKRLMWGPRKVPIQVLPNSYDENSEHHVRTNRKYIIFVT